MSGKCRGIIATPSNVQDNLEYYVVKSQFGYVYYFLLRASLCGFLMLAGGIAGLPFDRLAPFALGYWVEALSHRLIPAVDLMAPETVDMRSSFVDNGGIGVLISVLQSDRLRNTVFTDARLSCQVSFTRKSRGAKTLLTMCLQVATVGLIQHLLTEALALEPWNREVKSARDPEVADLEFSLETSEIAWLRQRSKLEMFELAVDDILHTNDPVLIAAQNSRMLNAFDATTLMHALLELFLETAPTASDDILASAEGKEKSPVTRTDEPVSKIIIELAGNLMRSLPGAIDAVLAYPRFHEFITSVIVGCHSKSIRIITARFILELVGCREPQLGSAVVANPDEPRSLETVMNALLKSRLPFWSVGPVQREGAARRAPHILEYFRLLFNLFSTMVKMQRSQVSVFCGIPQNTSTHSFVECRKS